MIAYCMTFELNDTEYIGLVAEDTDEGIKPMIYGSLASIKSDWIEMYRRPLKQEDLSNPSSNVITSHAHRLQFKPIIYEILIPDDGDMSMYTRYFKKNSNGIEVLQADVYYIIQIRRSYMRRYERFHIV